ncbi:peptidase M43 [bacterium 336/3]|nr:peptidase M43 [bacterium 336/3]
MKKLLLSAAVAAVMFSCQKNSDTAVMGELNTSNEVVARRGCASHEVLDRQIAEDPSLAKRMNDLEEFTKDAIANGRIVNGVLEIPVVFNVLYRTSAENISQAQLQSQIDVLNEDFQGRNADFNTANNPYSSVRAVVGYRFVLDQVIRKQTTRTSWGTNDACKKSAQGGLNPTSPTTKLNYWVATIGGGILGYAQFPGGSSATDGVVIDSKYTGRTGTATFPFNLGRTATHEVGHWMNLRHIWGDATCGNDFVSDTPVHNAANGGVPAVGHRSTCSGTPLEMYMNYMDYTDDRGMYMFSLGQKARMDAVFAVGGSRASFR